MDREGVEAQLTRYKGLIRRYHPTLDLVSERALTSIDDLIDEGRLYAELIESLSPAPRSLIDLGSGAGLPGIPIAASLPDLQVSLIERRRRRVSFLRIAVAQLILTNAQVYAGDIRDLRGVGAQVVTAQAVAGLDEIYRLSCHLHDDEVWLVTRRGDSYGSEIDRLEALSGATIAEKREVGIPRHGRLVAVRLSGGRACPPSG